MGGVASWLQTLSPAMQLALVVILLIVFKDDLVNFYRSRFGGDNDVEINLGNDHGIEEHSSKEWFDGITEIANKQGKQIGTLLELMGGLAQHYNHETTELLSQILEESKKANSKLNELEKYGFPTRNENYRERNLRENGL